MTLDTNRAAALTLASNVVERGTTAEATIAYANKLLAYMTVGEQTAAPAGQTTSTPAKATTPPAAPAKQPAVAPGKKAATKQTPAEKPAPTPPAEPEGETEIDYTGADGLEAVGKLVSQFIAANRRDEAIALLAEYDAAAVSGVKPADREAFCNEASALLATVDITK